MEDISASGRIRTTRDLDVPFSMGRMMHMPAGSKGRALGWIVDEGRPVAVDIALDIGGIVRIPADAVQGDDHGEPEETVNERD